VNGRAAARFAKVNAARIRRVGLLTSHEGAAPDEANVYVSARLSVQGFDRRL